MRAFKESEIPRQSEGSLSEMLFLTLVEIFVNIPMIACAITLGVYMAYVEIAKAVSLAFALTLPTAGIPSLIVGLVAFVSLVRAKNSSGASHEAAKAKVKDRFLFGIAMLLALPGLKTAFFVVDLATR